VCELANKPSQPNFAYIRSATVIPGNMAGINVRLYTDTAALVSFYRLERSLDNSNWTSIATLPPNFTDPNINYVDAGALVTQAPYFYRFIVVDSCNVDAITSPVASSMHLRVNANDSLFNQLTWTTYRGYNGNPTSYEVFRSVDGLWDPSPIISLPANQRTYRDDVSTYRLSGGTFEYYVNANEGLGNVYNLLDTSRSNSVGVVQKPRLYVPSAFYPGSSQLENAIFYPRGVYINSMDYLFIVYNRWGEKVFESNVVDLGWNGYFDGGEAPQGVYTYYIKFTTSSGILFEDRGTVTLIR
jgi:hypothetical protein